MDLRQGIIETANAIGLSPEELATIISYESGFNPNVWGGKGGNYYGLIQFGPAERAQYGVTVGDPSSQLGPHGAIARYFQDRGFKPGMGLLDAYSTVNAGRPGLYNRSDAAAGGMPGTVADKVRDQFGPHRARAQAFLGSADPNPPTGGQYNLHVRHPPNPTVSSTDTLGESPWATIAANAAAKEKRDSRSSAIEDIIGGIGGLGGGGGGGGVARTAPQLPDAPSIAMPYTPTIDPQQAANQRAELAQVLARLNTGRLWG